MNPEKILFTSLDNVDNKGFQRLIKGNSDLRTLDALHVNDDSIILVDGKGACFVKQQAEPYFKVNQIVGDRTTHITSDGSVFSVETSSNNLRQTTSSVLFKEGKEVYASESYEIEKFLKIDKSTIVGIGKFYYYNPNNANTLREGSCIIKSIDNGNTWNQTATTDYRLWDIDYSNNVLFVSGDRKTILVSTDKGDSFSIKYKDEHSSNSFTEVLFFDQNNGLAVENKELYQTTNGGKNWLLIDGLKGHGNYKNNVHKIDSLSAMVFFGESSNIAVTHDKGKNWSIINNNPFGSYIKEFASLSSDIYVSDNNKKDLWYHPSLGISTILRIDSLQDSTVCTNSSTNLFITYDTFEEGNNTKISLSTKALLLMMDSSRVH